MSHYKTENCPFCYGHGQVVIAIGGEIKDVECHICDYYERDPPELPRGEWVEVTFTEIDDVGQPKTDDNHLQENQKQAGR